MIAPSAIFDSHLRRWRQNRAAATASSDSYFLLHEMQQRLAERLGEIGSRFSTGLYLGQQPEAFISALETPTQPDDAAVSVGRWTTAASCSPIGHGHPSVVADEEFVPFAAASFDLIVTAGPLHLINDLPGALLQLQSCLRPGGLFLAALPGGTTLTELRQAWLTAETVIRSGVTPRVSPFVDLRDAAALLQRAGFAQPIADSDHVTVSYGDPLDLMRDLKNMGESNVLVERSRALTTPALLAAVNAAYRRAFEGVDGRIPATFELLFLTAWSGLAARPKSTA